MRACPQPEMPNVAQGRDMFFTPRYATELLLPFIPDNIINIWECAAGTNKISNVLREYEYNVFPTDINPIMGEVFYFNFISPLDVDIKCYDGMDHQAIITNPPFSLAHKFFQKCVKINLPFALLLGSNYCQWKIDAVRKYGCEKIVPTGRISLITPTGRRGKDSCPQFHTMWLTRYFNIGRTETFVDLTPEMKERIE